MLQTGTLIAGRYEILSPLASGGNGLVFSATDRTTEKRVAVKILGPHVLHERAAREKLRLEAIVAGRVESEHIVQVSDAGVDIAMGIPFLVMELLKGLDLQRHVEQSGPLDFASAVEYLRQVSIGLDKAHSWKDRDGRLAPIVHRDLKPENLFLTHREDGSPLIKILDFGLAKVLTVSATLSSEVKGTPLYMAPEQLTQAPITPATDVWALGLIGFFFLTGTCYWLSAQDSHAILPAVIKEVSEGAQVPARKRLRQLAKGIELPEAFDEWFAQCVHMDPTHRFRSAGMAIKALSFALDQPLVSSPLSAASGLFASLSDANKSEHVSSTRRSRPSMPSTPTATAISSPGAERRSLGPFSWVVAALAVLGAVVVWFTRGAPQSTQPTPDAGSARTAAAATTLSNSVATAMAPEPPTAGPNAARAATSLSAQQRQEEGARNGQMLSAGAAHKPLFTSGGSAAQGHPAWAAAKAANALAVPTSAALTRAAVAAASGHESAAPATSSLPHVPRDPADHR